MNVDSLKKESQELGKRIHDLNTLIQKSESDVDLLCIQLSAMETYQRILMLRIERMR